MEVLFDIKNFSLKCSAQIVFLKLVHYLTANKYGTVSAYEPIKKMQCSDFDINYYILHELYRPIDDLFDIMHKQIDSKKREIIVQDLQDELLIILGNGISKYIKTLTFKIENISTFQHLLIIIFIGLLARKVSKYSYGKEWFLTKLNGSKFHKINKNASLDNQTLTQVGIMMGTVLKINLVGTNS